MQDSYVIDGYNLIHALGMIQKNLHPGGLEASRRKFLEFLVQSFADAVSRVTVVFDAQHAARGGRRDQEFHGLSIRFAPKKESADDLIETLIEEHAEPRTLVVISNDMRLQNAARRRGARAWSHEALLDFFDSRPDEEVKAAPTPEKKDSISPEDAKKWMKEFKDVEADPDLKEFFEHDRFEGG